LTLVDWNFCLDFPMSRQKLDHIFSLNTEFSKFLHDVWKISAESEFPGYEDQWICCDVHAVVVALNPEIIKKYQ
jgi:inosine-uridine nucleoside N-ribohydrolase